MPFFRNDIDNIILLIVIIILLLLFIIILVIVIIKARHKNKLEPDELDNSLMIHIQNMTNKALDNEN